MFKPLYIKWENESQGDYKGHWMSDNSSVYDQHISSTLSNTDDSIYLGYYYDLDNDGWGPRNAVRLV